MPMTNNDVHADDMTGTLQADVNSLLGFAENLQDKCESYERWLTIYITIGLGMVSGILGVGFLLQSFSPFDSLVASLVSGVYCIAMGTPIVLIIHRMRRSLKRERRALLPRQQ